MPLKEDQETIDALKEQGGITNDPEVKADPEVPAEPEDNTAKDLPDIELNKEGEAAEENSVKPEDTDSKEASEPDKDDPNTGAIKTLQEAGYTEQDIVDRIEKDGDITDELINELKGKINPDFVDAHVARIKAEAKLKAAENSKEAEDIRKHNEVTQKMNDFIYNSVGGKDKFEIMGKTLKSEMSDDEIAALNAKLASGNQTVIREGLEAAVKKYNEIRGIGGNLMEGDAGNSVDAPVHITKEEYRSLMKTDKYKNDPKYAEKIDKDRLATREADAQRFGHGAYYAFHPSKGRYAL